MIVGIKAACHCDDATCISSPPHLHLSLFPLLFLPESETKMQQDIRCCYGNRGQPNENNVDGCHGEWKQQNSRWQTLVHSRSTYVTTPAQESPVIPDSKEVKDTRLKDARCHGYKAGNGQVLLSFYYHFSLYVFFILILSFWTIPFYLPIQTMWPRSTWTALVISTSQPVISTRVSTTRADFHVHPNSPPKSSIKLNIANYRFIVLKWTAETCQTLYQLWATAGLW